MPLEYSQQYLNYYLVYMLYSFSFLYATHFCWIFYCVLQLERHMRRLEHDLNRFTIELEADTAGITEILEQSKDKVLL